MTLKRLLLLLAAMTLPGLCLATGTQNHTLTYTSAAQPWAADLYLAEANTEQSSQPGLSSNPRSATADQLEFPHLNLPDTPDHKGLMHDSQLFLLYQVGVVGVLYLMPQSVSQWGDDQKNGNIFHKWNENVNSLRKDHDDWAINYIGHPYFGSVYYVRARQRGFERQDSLLYSFVMSTIYEYGVEAIFEPVSIQDLIFTPLGGAIIGEYFMTARENTMSDINNKGYASFGDNMKLFFTDPMGAINRKVDKAFGYKEASINLLPLFNPSSTTQHSLPPLIGLQAHLSW